MSVRTVPAAETSFLVRDAGEGDGTPVLLLHGVPETSSAWQRLMPVLADGRRVLAPDLPGLGGSSYGGPYDVPSLVAQLAALVEVESPGRPVDVVGHDWGGSLALALAGARPDLVRRLAVANAPYRSVPARAVHMPLFALPVLPEVLFRLGGRRAVGLLLGIGWRADVALDPAVRAEYEAAYSRPASVRAMLGYYRAATRPRLAAALRRAKRSGAPRVQADRMLVVWGARDPVLPVSTGEGVVRDLGPDCVMVTVPGAGHFVVEEAHEVVADVLRDFLGDAPGSDAAPPEGPDRHRAPQSAPEDAEEVPSVGLVPVGGTPEQQAAAPGEAPAGPAPRRRSAAAAEAPVKAPVKAKAPAKTPGARAKAPGKSPTTKAPAEAPTKAPAEAPAEGPTTPQSAPASGTPRSAAARRRPGAPEAPPSAG